MLHGLFIGINYAGTQNRLNGCINDARRWYNLFTGNRRLMIEAECTRVAVLKAIRDLVKNATNGDEIILTISSHGTDVKDKGIENDTAFVPYDLKLIIDDEFAELFSLTDVPITFITDCCNSGTMSRDLESTPRYIPYNQLPEQTLKSVPKSDNPHVVHLSGCKDEESSMDQKFGNYYYGNLTYHATNAYKPNMTFKQWYDSFMPLKKQTPQLSGPINRLVPGSKIITPTIQYPKILFRNGDTLYEPSGWRPVTDSNN